MINHKFIRFSIVGLVGFAVDALVFSVCLFGFGFSSLWSRVLSFVVAASTTWIGNRRFTFRSHSAPAGEWRKFLISATVSIVPNLSVFQLVLFGLGENHITVFIALVCGTLSGMLSNYFLSAKWVFR
jgi:putative flippase GtrA